MVRERSRSGQHTARYEALLILNASARYKYEHISEAIVFGAGKRCSAHATPRWHCRRSACQDVYPVPTSDVLKRNVEFFQLEMFSLCEFCASDKWFFF